MSTGGSNNNIAADAAASAAAATTNAGGNAAAKDPAYGTKKYGEPLFGPSIGSVSSGPGWTVAGEKKIMTDELTTEIVNGWIEKSKEPSNPTTTLQALVNLKRPTLRLSPLSASLQEDAAPSEHQHLHGLEFTYDCDTPKCGIYVYVHLAKDHPDAPPTQASLARLQVFEIIQNGGFGNKLTIEDGAILELERFEYVNGVAVGIRETVAGGSEDPVVSQAGGATADVTGSRDNVATNDNNTSSGNNDSHRRRFSTFPFRKLHLHRRVSGPALTVVDAERTTAAAAEDSKPDALKSKDGDGVKVTIRLVALDGQGLPFDSPNEQLIYLQIVREGTKSDAGEEEAKSWVVKVVKREATIGPHTFHLHEIYGLASSSSGAGTTPTPHTYPPDSSGVAQLPLEDDESPQSECLLCLSSPREVVLLPCRHLVACKECALNMVEYGAGGSISYGAEPAVGAAPEERAGDSGIGEGTGTGSVPASATSTTQTAAAARRKRKAKGWFCPVCREPYTSMLRLTTTAPTPLVIHDKGDGDGSGTEEDGEVEAARPELPTNNVNANSNNTNTNNNNNSEAGTGAAGPGFFRSGFLRTLSGLGRERPADVENQNEA